MHVYDIDINRFKHRYEHAKKTIWTLTVFEGLKSTNKLKQKYTKNFRLTRVQRTMWVLLDNRTGTV